MACCSWCFHGIQFLIDAVRHAAVAQCSCWLTKELVAKASAWGLHANPVLGGGLPKPAARWAVEDLFSETSRSVGKVEYHIALVWQAGLVSWANQCSAAKALQQSVLGAQML